MFWEFVLSEVWDSAALQVKSKQESLSDADLLKEPHNSFSNLIGCTHRYSWLWSLFLGTAPTDEDGAELSPGSVRGRDF